MRASLAGQYWLNVEDDVAWVVATVESRFDAAVELRRLDNGESVSLSEEEFAKLRPVTSDPTASVDDLVHMNDVNAGALLNNLRLRYNKDEIFTTIGPGMLITVNPYKPLAICSAEHMSAMKDAANPEALPPHIFKLAHSAYSRMLQTVMAQSILVSGESGAGKTEATKLCMACLAEISGSSGESTEAALESGILLEAIGNAKTVHNNNSSRFGKWCAVHFSESGKISACKVLSYLLEKSRVVGPGEGERNYHIFYQLLAGATAEQRAQLHLLSSPGEYLYLQGPPTVEGVSDEEEWVKTVDKLGSLGFSEAQQAEILRIYAAILILGNVAFVSASESERMTVMDAKPLATAAELLMVGQTQLENALLTRKVASGRGSSYTVPLTEQQCLDTRDALAKALYTTTFDWVVERLNVHMSREAGTDVDEEGELFVGLLDVFGFENFEFNSFEQLCINYTNEKLQQQFIDALVKLQQLDYEREGLKHVDIAFPDNSEQLALLESRMGVMGLLDEECALPKGSEATYVEKMHKFFSQTPYYEKPSRGGVKVKRRSVLPSALPTSAMGKDLDKLQFSIIHYAGKVTYTAESWLDKNRGFLQPDLAFVLSTSSAPLLQSLFMRRDDAVGSARNLSRDKATVLSSFRQSLRSLSSTLLQTNARYIRCVKPNAEKQPNHFHGHFISRQLRYTGVSAVVEIQRSGYPISLLKTDFVRRYRCCAFSEPQSASPDLPPETVCANLLA